ncbi:nuclear transport factor 2 family protein [Caulobacter sp. CCH9-E1]|uniref:nuclear transport factor 2 family protein n=1 Tax=Caulobacter sp. CCH9-E1 TaxID=1768768 RepID=UPI0008350977|nr:nuclear transport factor 2 family protein [Caulobacter sp. CCH9-E1]
MKPAPPDIQARVERLYDTNQRRDFTAFRALAHPHLEWPDLTRGGTLDSPEAVRDYWIYNDRALRIEMTPVKVELDDEGRIVVLANQVVWNLAGKLWSDLMVRHRYTLRDGLFWRLEVLEIDRPRP